MWLGRRPSLTPNVRWRDSMHPSTTVSSEAGVPDTRSCPPQLKQTQCTPSTIVSSKAGTPDTPPTPPSRQGHEHDDPGCNNTSPGCHDSDMRQDMTWQTGGAETNNGKGGDGLLC